MSNTIELNCFLHPIVEMNVTFIFVEIFEELTCYYFFENYIFKYIFVQYAIKRIVYLKKSYCN